MMGRQVRRVPKDWEHPKDENGYRPMYDEAYEPVARQWAEDCALWEKGEHPDQEKYPDEECKHFWEWNGGPPGEEYYRPDWPEESRTHYQMYEDTSEGTPISPVVETPEELARWLADTGASSFADRTATYEQWLAVCKGGWAPSAIIIPGKGMISGVEMEK